MKKIKSILVVGGGTSGWMAAAYLNKTMKNVKVSLIESDKIPVIGVGEATTIPLHSFMSDMGYSEGEWMFGTRATFKAGIRFDDWYEKGNTFWHPFEKNYGKGSYENACWYYLHRTQTPGFEDKESYAKYMFETATTTLENNIVPPLQGHAGWKQHAWHFNAQDFQKWLMNENSDVTHYIDDVTNVAINKDGIDFLVTKNSGVLQADLYIDASGFRRLLMGKLVPDMNFTDYAPSLFCDSAVFGQVAYKSEETKNDEMHPYTRAEAKSSGWIWTIPVLERIGTGYVYSSKHQSKEDAEQEFKEHWGEDRMKDVNIGHLTFPTGLYDQPWVKNCVTIGLSTGFVEPLESTGVLLIQLGITELQKNIEFGYYDESDQNHFNTFVHKEYADIVDFIVAHYMFTKRDDTQFWRDVQNKTLIPDRLKCRLETFKAQMPTEMNARYSIFPKMLSWMAILTGNGFQFDLPKISALEAASWGEEAKRKQAVASHKAKTLPKHYDYLKLLYNRVEAGEQILNTADGLEDVYNT